MLVLFLEMLSWPATFKNPTHLQDVTADLISSKEINK